MSVHVGVFVIIGESFGDRLRPYICCVGRPENWAQKTYGWVVARGDILHCEEYLVTVEEESMHSQCKVLNI